MSVYDDLEKAGHDVTLVCGMTVGVSTYVCENCGSLLKLRNDEIILFHAAPCSAALPQKCQHWPPTPGISVTLKSKLEKLEAEDWARLKQAMDD